MSSISLPHLSQEELAKAKEDTIQLIEALRTSAQSKNKKGQVKKITKKIFNSDIEIDSWKFQEWDYYSKKVRLPSHARGLFTINYEIVIRGYDKFFNLGEFQHLSKDTLDKETTGPYTLTVKTNGCIVFVSGLKDGTLIVCSKHSTGFRDDVTRNHAWAAQTVIERNLLKIGSTSRQLALELYESGITAVAEYCDDEFEEHVLEYKGDKAGLYLHGLNYNISNFKTLPMEIVNVFAEKYGFKTTDFFRFETFDETMKYLENAAKSGTYEGEEVEGFVIRCFNSKGDYFFKFKFEEPYLLYRQFREVTKVYIHKGYDSIRFRDHKLVCMDYLKFVIPILESNQQLKDDFQKNKRVVELRKKYIQAKGKTGLELIDDEISNEHIKDEAFAAIYGNKQSRYAIVPVATIGCGKTTVALILTNLYHDLVGHIQNDNLSNPVKDKLVKGALELMVNKQIVVLDKNNHKYLERKQIFDHFDELNKLIPKDKLKFICLNFISDESTPSDELWEVTKVRVLERGDNHQSIKSEKDGREKAEAIMKGFVSRFQPLNPKREPDSNFDLIINLKVNKNISSLDNAKVVVEELSKFIKDIELRQPTDQEYQEAFQKALNYKPEITKTFKTKKTQKIVKPRYFGIDIPDKEKLLSLVYGLISKSEDARRAFQSLLSNNRIQDEFHVTLLHSIQVKHGKQYIGLWKNYTELYFRKEISELTKTIPKLVHQQFNLSQSSTPYNTRIKLNELCWDDKVMCISIEILRILRPDGELLDIKYGNKYLHITIGTSNEKIGAVESNRLLSDLYEFRDFDKVKSLKFDDDTVLDGLPLFAQF